MAGYSGTPLVKKLGIKPAATLALLSAPDGFTRLLDGLPADVRVVRRRVKDINTDRSRGPTPARGAAALEDSLSSCQGGAAAADVTIWFVSTRRDLDRRIASVATAMGAGLWISWPKKASGQPTDLNENLVRDAGLACGLVDYKVCAIDDTWSGLKFARRKPAR
jgi:hypothetical protein